MNKELAIECIKTQRQFVDDLTREAFDIAIDLLKQPQHKKGKWIHDGYAFKGGIDWMHCSECGHNDSWSVATRTPFCAWCGADMREDGEADANVES